MDIDYSRDWFTTKYVSSENLHYRRKNNGSEQIHPKFNSWVAKLNRQIAETLRQQVAIAAASDPITTAPQVAPGGALPR